jgi:hypothetical protein
MIHEAGKTGSDKTYMGITGDQSENGVVRNNIGQATNANTLVPKIATRAKPQDGSPYQHNFGYVP